DLVGKVHMARGVDQVQLIGLAVPGGVVHGDGPGLDGDAAFPLDVHIVQDLVGHGPLVHALGQLQDAVGQGGFAVADVRGDADMADVLVCHGSSVLDIEVIVDIQRPALLDIDPGHPAGHAAQ